MVLCIKTEEEFTNIVLNKSDKKYVVVDFYADWCRPCVKYAPRFEELSKEYGDIIYFMKVNIDDCPDLMKKYEVESIPTFVLLNIGSLETKYEKIVGANDSKIVQMLNYLQSKYTDDDDF